MKDIKIRLQEAQELNKQNKSLFYLLYEAKMRIEQLEQHLKDSHGWDKGYGWGKGKDE